MNSCRFVLVCGLGMVSFFCEAVTYHFDRIYTVNLFSLNVDQLFPLHKKKKSLLCIWASQKLSPDIVSASVNRSMNV